MSGPGTETTKKKSKNRKGQEKVAVLSMRVGTSFANPVKVAKVKEHLLRVKDLKNEMSTYCYRHLRALLADPAEFKKQYKNFQCEFLYSLEAQLVFYDVVDSYMNHYKQLKHNGDFLVQTGSRIEYYRKNIGDKKKGDIRSFLVETKRHHLSGLLKLLTFLDLANIEKYIEPALAEYAPAQVEGEISQESKLSRTLRDYVGTKYWAPLVRIAKLRLDNIFARFRKPHDFTTGSYRKLPWPTGRFDKDGKEKTSHSPFVEDRTNSEFKLFLAYKIGSGKSAEIIHLPISTGRSKYHKRLMKAANLDASYIVTETPKGKIDIIITRRAECHALTGEPMAIDNTTALDVNTKRNLFSDSNGEFHDYDRKLVDRTFKELVKLETLKAKATGTDEGIPPQVVRRIGKRCRALESEIKRQISRKLDREDQRGTRHLILEDLALTDTKASFIKNAEFGQKYSKLVRNLRLSSVAKWTEEQAARRGIRVHLAHSHYSSQECPKCHFADRGNRPCQEKFKCLSCGNEGDADLVAAQNLMNRFFLSDVLRDTLHVQNDDGNYRPRGLRKETLKRILESSGEGKTQFEVSRSAISKTVGIPEEIQDSEAPLSSAAG